MNQTTTPDEFDFNAALADPSKHFAEPAEILAHQGLTPEQKLELLQQWELDARLLSVAEGENMEGDEPNPLAEIRKAIAALREDHDGLPDTDAASQTVLGS